MRRRIAIQIKIHIGLIAVFLFALASIPLRSPVLAENAAPDSSVADVRIGVLGLFHPTQVEVRAPEGVALILRAGKNVIVLENSSGISAASVLISGSNVIVSAGAQSITASKLIVTGRDSKPADFLLAVPGKIVRRYHGILETRPTAGTLTSVITMDREIAVASVVAAENAPDTPFEALEAQAVATRSYFITGGRPHYDFDFCDTTHCQFLREPPAPGTAAARAVNSTRDLVLVYDSHPVAAMYTRRCTGARALPRNWDSQWRTIRIFPSSANIAGNTHRIGQAGSQAASPPRCASPTKPHASRRFVASDGRRSPAMTSSAETGA